MNLPIKMIIAILLTSSFVSLALAEGTQGMPGMPLIEPKKSYTVNSKDQGEQLLEQRGFGDQEGEVRMMNLMMVEGSGFEGMDMSDPVAMKAMEKGAAGSHGGHNIHAAHGAAAAVDKGSSYHFGMKATPDSAKVGANILIIHLTSAQTGKPVQGVKIKAQVYMTSMDMGTVEPRVREVKPAEYQVKVNFSMAGPWAVKLITSEGEKVFDFQVTK